MLRIKKVFSGEVFFAFFLFSGVFKESLNFPIDLAAFFLVLTTIAILKRIYINSHFNKNYILPISLFIMLIFLVLVSFFYSSSTLLWTDKTIKIILLTTPAFMYPFLLFRTKESLIQFLTTISFIAIIMSIFSIPMIFERGTDIGFVGFNNGNYLGLSRVNSIGIIILLFLGLLRQRNKKQQAIFLIPIVVVLISLISSGGRMPVIAVSFALILGVLQSVSIQKGNISYPRFLKRIASSLVILVLPLLWAYQQGFFNSLLFRLQVLFSEDDGGRSALGRTDRLIASIELWKENSIGGAGFGSFGVYYNKAEMNDYPHNIFFEILSELGIIGFLIFLALLVVTFFRLWRLSKIREVRNDNLFITVIMVFLVMLLNAMVSGDINGNRALFTFIAIINLLPTISLLKSNNSKIILNKFLD